MGYLERHGFEYLIEMDEDEKDTFHFDEKILAGEQQHPSSSHQNILRKARDMKTSHTAKQLIKKPCVQCGQVIWLSIWDEVVCDDCRKHYRAFLKNSLKEFHRKNNILSKAKEKE